jgi:hypothetical protein
VARAHNSGATAHPNWASFRETLSIAIIAIKDRPDTVAELARIPMAQAGLSAFPLSDNRKRFERKTKAHHGRRQCTDVAVMQRKRE